MSLTATLVMAAVVTILIVAWLALVFRAGRPAAREGKGRGGAS